MNNEHASLAHKVAFFRADANLNVIPSDLGTNAIYEVLYWESREDTDRMSLADLRDEFRAWTE